MVRRWRSTSAVSVPKTGLAQSLEVCGSEIFCLATLLLETILTDHPCHGHLVSGREGYTVSQCLSAVADTCFLHRAHYRLFFDIKLLLLI